MPAILLILSFAILVTLIILTYRIHAISKKQTDEEKQQKTGLIQSWIYAAIICTIIAIIASIYWMVKGTVYESHLMEWLNIVVG